MMMSENEAKELVQAMAAIAQMTKVYYDNCIQLGFEPIQALELSKVILESLLKNK